MNTLSMLQRMSAREYSAKNMDKLKLYNRIKDDNYISNILQAFDFIEKGIGKSVYNINDILKIDNIQQLKINSIDYAIVYIARCCMINPKMDTIDYVVSQCRKIANYIFNNNKSNCIHIANCLTALSTLAYARKKSDDYDRANGSHETATLFFAKAYYTMMYYLYHDYINQDEYTQYMVYNYNMLLANADIEYNNGSYESK